MAKLCPKCGESLDASGFCGTCNISISVYKKIKDTSKILYNQGLQKARVRDLSSAIDLLTRSIRLDKENIDARNLLGLVYFEIGETVSALQQWVVSKNLQGDNNDALHFINKVQNSQSYLDKLGTAIKKYNQSLIYIEQNSVDLAIIQLKKVISLNPNFVKAYCLLALCYYKEENIDKAQKILKKVMLIDKSSYVARKYLDEFSDQESHIAAYDEPVMEVSDGYNGPSLSRNKFKMSNAMIQFVTMLLGVAIGLSVMIFLVMPSRIQDKEEEKNQYASQVTDLEAIRNEMEAEINTLKSDIQLASNENSELSGDLEQKQNKLDEMIQLVSAFEKYVVDDMASAAAILKMIDPSMLEEETQIVYTSLTTEIYPTVAYDAWTSGYDDYRLGRYEAGIDNLETAFLFEQNDYYTDETLYYLGRCYQKLNDNEKALEIFNKLLDEYPDATAKIRNDAAYYAKIISN